MPKTNPEDTPGGVAVVIPACRTAAAIAGVLARIPADIRLQR